MLPNGESSTILASPRRPTRLEVVDWLVCCPYCSGNRRTVCRSALVPFSGPAPGSGWICMYNPLLEIEPICH